jgi:hypothetical protein
MPASSRSTATWSPPRPATTASAPGGSPTSTSFEPEQTDDAREAVEALERFVIERAGAQFADWQQRRDEAEPGWAEHTGIAQSLVYLTLDEMAALHRVCCWAPARPSSACWT